MPLPALGELPQLTALSLAWRRLVEVKAVVNQKDDDSAQFLVPPTQLTLKLSFYDLTSISNPPLHGSKATLS